jgi:hypothetical protein
MTQRDQRPRLQNADGGKLVGCFAEVVKAARAVIDLWIRYFIIREGDFPEPSKGSEGLPDVPESLKGFPIDLIKHELPFRLDVLSRSLRGLDMEWTLIFAPFLPREIRIENTKQWTLIFGPNSPPPIPEGANFVSASIHTRFPEPPPELLRAKEAADTLRSSLHTLIRRWFKFEKRPEAHPCDPEVPAEPTPEPSTWRMSSIEMDVLRASVEVIASMVERATVETPLRLGASHEEKADVWTGQEWVKVPLTSEQFRVLQRLLQAWHTEVKAISLRELKSISGGARDVVYRMRNHPILGLILTQSGRRGTGYGLTLP